MKILAPFFILALAGVGAWFGLNRPLLIPAATTGVPASTSSDSSENIFGAQTSASVQSTATNTLPTGSGWLTTLPLGDNKYTTTDPKKGYVYLCHIQSGGGGAQVNGPWIHGATWNPSEKIRVEGAVSWPQATYKMSISGSARTIKSNDLPTDDTTGTFPIASTDPAAQYDRNPSSINAHSYSFSLPAYPSALSKPGCIYGEVGIMNNGVLLFDGFDALYRDALAHELQDAHDGHPNNEGYHKHGFISDIKNLSVSKVVGFAFDGYPITGPMVGAGKYLVTADLDECHGITSSIMLDGKMQSSYHYVLTQDFPYSASCFHGTSKITPQDLMSGGGGSSGVSNPSTNTAGNPQGQGGTPPAPPQEAIDACSGKSSGASCSVGAAVTGTCATIGTYFACLPR